MLLLGIDFESTGLLVNEDRIIEIGAVLWDTDRQCPLKILNLLVNPGVPVSEVITEITGITQEDVTRWGDAPAWCLMQLVVLIDSAEAVVAHNGTLFDRPLFEAECKRHLPNVVGEFRPQHWIDTSVDVPYPKKIQTRKLTHLAADHGFVNPMAHRAISDVFTMLKVLSHYDINEVVRLSKEPSFTLVALVKKPWDDKAPDGTKDTDKAKARGYRFDGGNKRWLKKVRQSDLEAEQSHGEFKAVIVET